MNGTREALRREHGRDRLARRGRVVDVATGRALTDARAVQLHSVALRHRDRDFHVRRILAAADLVALGIGAVSAHAVRGSAGSAGWSLPLLLALLPGWIALFSAYGLYGRVIRRVSHTLVDDLPSVFHAFVVGAVCTWFMFIALPVTRPHFATLLVFCAVAASTMLLFRSSLRSVLRRTLGPERVLLLGVGAATSAIVRSMREFPEYGQEPVGVLELPGRGVPAGPLEVRYTGTFDERSFDEVLRLLRVDRVLVSGAGTDEAPVLNALRRCRQLSIKISVLPALLDALGPSMEVDHIAGITLLGVNPPVLSRSSRITKRLIDIVGSATLLLASAPLLVVAALAIKLDSRGPVFFVQRRVGRGGRSFPLLKFRTMVVDAESRRQALLSQSKEAAWLHLDHDPRITRVGRLLRHSSLDEFPQLVNVLLGHMSLVGPRPLIAEEDEQVTGWQRARLDLTPGITGLWQVLGRTAIPFEDMVKLDCLYVTNWSLWSDIRLLLQTLPVVVSRRGVN